MIYEDSCLVNRWDCNQVNRWFQGLETKISQLASVFLKSNYDGNRLLVLTNKDLSQLGIEDNAARKRINYLISKLLYLTYDINEQSLQKLYLNGSVTASNLLNLIAKIYLKDIFNSDILEQDLKVLYAILDNLFNYIMNLIRNFNDIIHWLGKYSFNLDQDLEAIKISTCFLCLEIIDMSTNISNFLIHLGQQIENKGKLSEIVKSITMPILEYHDLMESVRTFCKTVARAAGKLDPIFVTPPSLQKIVIKSSANKNENSKKKFSGISTLPTFHGSGDVKEAESDKKSCYKFVYDHLLEPTTIEKPSFVSYIPQTQNFTNTLENHNIWGIHVTIENDWHTISAIEPCSPAAGCARLEVGAEIVEINEQIIVGWDIENVRALLKGAEQSNADHTNPKPCLNLLVRSYTPIQGAFASSKGTLSSGAHLPHPVSAGGSGEVCKKLSSPDQHSKSDDELLEAAHRKDDPSSSPSNIRRKSLVKQAVLEYIDKVYHDDSRALTSPSTQKTLDMVKEILSETKQFSPSHLTKYGLLTLSPPNQLEASPGKLFTLPAYPKPKTQRLVKTPTLNRRVTIDQITPTPETLPSTPDKLNLGMTFKRTGSKRYQFWKQGKVNASLEQQPTTKNKAYNQRLPTIPLHDNYQFHHLLPSPARASMIFKNKTAFQDYDKDISSPTAMETSTSFPLPSQKPNGQEPKVKNRMKKSLTFLYHYFHHRIPQSIPAPSTHQTPGKFNYASPPLVGEIAESTLVDEKGQRGGDMMDKLRIGQMDMPTSNSFSPSDNNNPLKGFPGKGAPRKSPPYILPFYGDDSKPSGPSFDENGVERWVKSSLRRLRSSSDALDLAEPQAKFTRANKPKALTIPPNIDNTLANQSLVHIPSEPSLRQRSWVLVKKVCQHAHHDPNAPSTSTLTSPLEGVVRIVSPGAILPPSLNQGWYQARADLFLASPKLNGLGASVVDSFSRDHLYLNLETPSWSNAQNKVNFQRESYYLPDFMVKPSIRMHNCIKLMNRDMILYMALSSHLEFKKWLQNLKPISNGHYHIQQTIASSDNWPSSDESKSSPNIPSSSSKSLNKNMSFNEKLERLKTLFNLSPNVVRKVVDQQPEKSSAVEQGIDSKRQNFNSNPYAKYLMGKAWKFASTFHGGE